MCLTNSAIAAYPFRKRVDDVTFGQDVYGVSEQEPFDKPIDTGVTVDKMVMP